MHTKGYYILHIIMYLCYDDKMSLCGLRSKCCTGKPNLSPHFNVYIHSDMRNKIRYTSYSKEGYSLSYENAMLYHILSEKYDRIIMRILFLRHNSLSLSHTQTKAL